MLNIIYNNYIRMLEKKTFVIVSIFLTICAVSAAIIITNNFSSKGNIALISENTNIKSSLEKNFNVTKLDSIPNKSDLVQSKYDAIVIDNNGEYSVQTIRNNEFESMIYSNLNNSDKIISTSNKERQIGTNIIGYIMMFVLMQGTLYANLFAEDREKHIIERISTSSTKFKSYLFGNMIFIGLMIFIPVYLVILCTKLLGINIGLSLTEYLLLIFICTLLSSAFALFMNTICKAETATMVGSAIIVLTTILSGSFSSIIKDNTILYKLLNLFPQKGIIIFADGLEKGALTSDINLKILYVMCFSVILISIAIMKLKRMYSYGK